MHALGLQAGNTQHSLQLTWQKRLLQSSLFYFK